jgi:hypothetical protein
MSQFSCAVQYDTDLVYFTHCSVEVNNVWALGARTLPALVPLVHRRVAGRPTLISAFKSCLSHEPIIRPSLRLS